ncbi:MAG: hypothetical protein AUH16_12580 [Acidobacteria bacterium 13_2_20CM_57_7]|nr:MAG: hypothetical protein AUH16_12580 [Acidobacteria bacterium 13_2_20CM_57_7]
MGDSFLKTRDQRLLPDRVRGSAERQGCHPIEDLGRGHQIQFVWRQPMNRQLLFVLSLLLFPTACLAQTTPNDSKTLQSLLLEVRQLRQDLQTTTIAGQRAQILIYRVQGQEAAVARASQRLDEFREKLARIQDERKHVAADVKRFEDSLSSSENPPTQRKEIEQGMLPQLKTRLESRATTASRRGPTQRSPRPDGPTRQDSGERGPPTGRQFSVDQRIHMDL